MPRCVQVMLPEGGIGIVKRGGRGGILGCVALYFGLGMLVGGFGGWVLVVEGWGWVVTGGRLEGMCKQSSGCRRDL